jgi:hypothetical protein
LQQNRPTPDSAARCHQQFAVLNFKQARYEMIESSACPSYFESFGVHVTGVIVQQQADLSNASHGEQITNKACP